MHLAAAIMMMSFSSGYHLFYCMGHEEAVLMRSLDLCGICIMICGSTTPPFYYGFMCDDNRSWGYFYIGQVWLFCFVATYLTMIYRNRPEKKMLCAIAFIVAGYSTGPGMIHLGYYSEDTIVRAFPVWPYLTGGILYAGGAIIFALKIPERYVPRTFDIWFQSHTIFHWMCLAAAILHMWASIRVFHER